MKNEFKRKIISFLIVIFCIGLIGCNNKEKSTIKIGAVLPLSGNSAIIGEPKKRAMDIALDEFSNSKEVEFSILYEDSKGNPKDGINAFQKLLNSKSIKYYYIDLTTIVNASIPLINANEVITFAGSAEPKVTNLSSYLFRLFAGGDQEINLLVKYLKKENINNVFVLHTNELYGLNAFRYLEERFSKEGGNILGHEEYPMNNTNFRDILFKAKAQSPDKIILLGYGNEYSVLLKQAKELSMNGNDFVCNLGGSNKTVGELSGEYIDGMTFIGPKFTYLLSNNQLEPEMQLFVEKYQKKYKEIPDFRAAYTYDVIKILVDIWKRGIDPNKLGEVRGELVKLKNYKGASGNISFLENGDTETDLVIAKYNENRIILWN